MIRARGWTVNVALANRDAPFWKTYIMLENVFQLSLILSQSCLELNLAEYVDWGETQGYLHARNVIKSETRNGSTESTDTITG